MKKKPLVYLGLSGGVDSAVAAALLLEQGYEVKGVFLKIWSDQIDEKQVCPWVKDRRDAIAVAAKLNIPIETVDFQEEYKKEVFSYFVKEYSEGRTPNPDILCNTVIKFGAFLDYALSQGADYIATGHHARRMPQSGNHDEHEVKLLAGIDSKKDQSYFLAGLNQHQLRHTLFPIGNLTKDEVRQKARELDLTHVAEKPSTKGICFVGDVDLKQFLQKYAIQKPGEIVDPSGNVIGKHEGVAYYTIGQRKGLAIPAMNPESQPYFVVAKDAETNRLLVSDDIMDLSEQELFAKDAHWISGNPPEFPLTARTRFRYNQPLQEATIRLDHSIDENGLLHVRFAQPQKAIAPGQIVAFYQGDELLGSALIV